MVAIAPDRNQRRLPGADDMGPQWEWRVFAESSLLGRARSYFVGAESDSVVETYLLSLISAHAVRLRDNVLEIDRLEETKGDGLERWSAATRASFPLDSTAISAARQAWGLQVPIPMYAVNTPYEFLETVVSPVAWVRPVTVHERRTPIHVDNCWGEFTELEVAGSRWQSLALADVDPVEVARATRQLGFRLHENTNFPEALKRMVEFSPARKP